MKNTVLTILMGLALPALSHAGECPSTTAAKADATASAKSGACCAKGTTRAAAFGDFTLIGAKDTASKDTAPTAVKGDVCEAGACDDYTTFAVAGMTCGKCSTKVATALKGVEGVKDVKVNHETGKACVKAADGKEVKAETVMAAIKEAGFKPEGQLVSYKVKNMTCTGCSASLTKTLAATDGVIKVSGISHESGQAEVVIDPTKTDLAKVKTAINSTKFKVD